MQSSHAAVAAHPVCICVTKSKVERGWGAAGCGGVWFGDRLSQAPRLVEADIHQRTRRSAYNSLYTLLFCIPGFATCKVEGGTQTILPRSTTASFALQAPLLQVSRPSPLPLWPPFKVANIYQRFTPEAEGLVENIIEFSVPGVLEGAVQRVPSTQSWEPRSCMRLTLPCRPVGCLCASRRYAWKSCSSEAA